MADVPLPTPGGDRGVWDTILNTFLTENVFTTTGWLKTPFNIAGTTELANFTGTSSPYFDLEDTTGTLRFQVSGGAGAIGMHTNHALALKTNNTDRITITAAGNVGIGISPTVKFDCGGHIRATLTGGTPTFYLNDGTVQWLLQHAGSAGGRHLIFNDGTAERMRLTYTGGNLGLGQTTFGSSATKTLAIGAGTAPSSSPADAAQVYVQDIIAGNAAIHTRTEGGAIIKLYQQSHIADPAGGATVDAEARTAINSILAALENAGFLATS